MYLNQAKSFFKKYRDSAYSFFVKCGDYMVHNAYTTDSGVSFQEEYTSQNHELRPIPQTISDEDRAKIKQKGVKTDRVPL